MKINFSATGDGPPVLIMHGAAEDAELLQPQADALAARGYRVITYDRRGTGASSRRGWPEGGVATHVADAAQLITQVAGAPATVLGLSSGGVVALALVECHPELVSRVIAWEAPVLAILPDGLTMHAHMLEPINQFLRTHPGNWSGAYDIMITIMSGGAADLQAPAVQRMRRNAESALRDDGPLITAHPLRPSPGVADVIIATGAQPDPLLARIASALAAAYETEVWAVAGADDHEIYLSRPEALADALSSRLVRLPAA